MKLETFREYRAALSKSMAIANGSFEAGALILADALIFLAAHKEAAEIEAEQKREEARNWQSAELGYSPYQECPYCRTKNAVLLKRGTMFFGCTTCVEPFIVSLTPVIKSAGK